MVTNKEEQLVKLSLTQKLNSFKKFMGIDIMPSYSINLNTITNQNDYTVIASYKYNVQTDEHKLIVPDNIHNYISKVEYILFHEFTHMYDVMTYSANDRILYAKNRGFTEYHASQIELLNLLGATSISDNISFSLSQSIKTIEGDMTVIEYITGNLKGARVLTSNKDFPQSVDTLSTVIGMVFNALGRISICRMYANDYESYKDELEDMKFEKSYFGENFSNITQIMQGFLDKEIQTKVGELYWPIIEEQFQKIKV